MKFQAVFHDVSENLRTGVQPVFCVPRPTVGDDAETPSKPFNAPRGRTGRFWVPTRPVLGDDAGWSLTSKSDDVRVPMFSYKTASPSKARLVASGIEVGWRAVMTLMPLLKGGRPTEMTIILGHECHHTKAGYDFYVGLMVRTD